MGFDHKKQGEKWLRGERLGWDQILQKYQRSGGEVLHSVGSHWCVLSREVTDLIYTFKRQLLKEAWIIRG